MGRYRIVFVISMLNLSTLAAQNTVTLTIDATMDLYRAGGYNDGSNGVAPVVFTFPARAWRTMTIPAAGGAWTCQTGFPEYGPDGQTSGACLTQGTPTNFNSIGPLSGYHLTDFLGALAGVFLEDALPVSAPPALRFYVSNNSAGGIQTDFLALSPEIGQVFFIGDGLTGTGTGQTQTFRVPRTATHLYLGYVDNCMAPNNTTPGCYSDNVGSVNVTVRLHNYAPDWVEPTPTSAPSARIAPSMAYDTATHSTVLFGGSSAFFPGVSYGDTWVWRNGWTQLSPADSPPPRGAAGMANDPTTGTVVLFGGSDNSSGLVYGDTWTWDGVTWTQQFPPVSPPARSPGHSMMFDPAAQSVLLFGGYGPSAPFGDTWEWNGRTKTWTQMFPSSSPIPRGADSLAYDPITRTVLLFAGDNGGGDCCRIYYGDTWTWDGVNWTQQFPPSSPPPRTAHSMANDADLDRVIVFGGTSGPPQALNDTWAWNGKTWTQLTPANQPSARYWSNMDFDPLSGGLVLFGGELTGDIVTNNTWLFVPVPVR